MSTSGWLDERLPGGVAVAADHVEDPRRKISAAISAKRIVVIGVVSAGFSTIVLPVASAGPIFQIAIING